jgi:protocatechuate 3,4-dioxygenase alpha subunit
VLDIGLFDGAGEPVRDALIELWQADSLGHHHAPGWLGWGRAAADAADGRYRFETIKPGAVPPRAPFVSLFIVARGINLGLHTRVYFEGDELGRDPLLQRLGARAGRLLATRRDDGMGWGLDLHLAGPQEAVFLEAAAG